MTRRRNTDALGLYDRRLAFHRDAFARRDALALLENETDGDGLLLFLIHYCALGAAMTRPVEGWIRRAGKRCLALGYGALGEGLVAHAPAEAGHHELMLADLRALCARWNATARTPIAPDSLASMPPPAPVRRYRRLHERICTGDRPFAQVAVEYEIEALSVRHGAPLVAAARRRLGLGDGDGLSFLVRHVALDDGHTRYNRRLIGRFLAENPAALDPLVEAGAEALAIYGDFIDDCARRALVVDDVPLAARPTLRLHPPPGPAARRATPAWLTRLRLRRAEVMFDGGRRPAFGPSAAARLVADPLDEVAHHIVLSAGDRPVGMLRVASPLPAPGRSAVFDLFGRRGYERAVADLPAARPVFEASGLALDRDQRSGGTVRRLLAAAWLLAARSGAATIIAAAGTADRQDRFLALYGARPVDGVAPVAVPRLADTVRLMRVTVDPGAEPPYPEIAAMRRVIDGPPQSGLAAIRPAATL